MECMASMINALNDAVYSKPRTSQECSDQSLLFLNLSQSSRDHKTDEQAAFGT